MTSPSDWNSRQSGESVTADAARIDAVAQEIEAETHARGAALDAARRMDALVAVERVRRAYAKGGAHPVLCDQLTDASALLITREELLVERAELCAEVDALHAERDGRTVPPTPAEVGAHGGWWLVLLEDGKGPPMPWTTRCPLLTPAPTIRFLRFIPLVDGCPCVWPTVAEGGAP